MCLQDTISDRDTGNAVQLKFEPPARGSWRRHRPASEPTNASGSIHCATCRCIFASIVCCGVLEMGCHTGQCGEGKTSDDREVPLSQRPLRSRGLVALSAQCPRSSIASNYSDRRPTCGSRR
eukprot:TRINITY_DN944_c0_g1_i2.p1 TRINITY_DN944_c0_g1~~TRINITY_DN944_c0_g1_i2.p1  ORF type:complete len:122 (+),score=4.13 TRINITY_DN944_c0_g1_i2:591-956(+)